MTTTGARPEADPALHPAADAGSEDDWPPDRPATPPEPAPEPRPGTAEPQEPAAVDSPSASDDLGATDALPRIFKIVGGIVAPTSLLTGLLFYFGRSRSAGFYRYFNVNSTVLDLSTNDYLFSGVDGLFVPISVTCLLALVLLWLNRLLLTRVPEGTRRRVIRILAPACGVVGAVLVVLAFADLFTEGEVFGVNSYTGGLALALGVIMLVYAVRLIRLAPAAGVVVRRRSQGTVLAEWGAAFLLVSIGLFWAADGYAFGVGTGGAITLHRALPVVPEAVLYSQQSLSMNIPGVTEVECTDAEAAFRFRYDGLRLVRQAGDQYLLLPATWDRATGTAVLIPRSGSVRLEFRQAIVEPGPC
jgi:hypothetical protein